MRMLDVKFIGLGGIGSILCEKICRFITYSKDLSANIMLVDGDTYEVKNLERQEFSKLGPKAKIKENDLYRKFKSKNLLIQNRDMYVNSSNIKDLIKENDIVFLSVDNHNTRKLVSDHCGTLENVTLISGGNDYVDGNVQLYVRQDNEDLTPNLGSYHPEIMLPEDSSPEDASCEELQRSEPQLYFTNLTVATIMCWMFYNVIIRNYVDENSEVYFDIEQMKVDPKIRKVKKGERRNAKVY